MKLWLPGILLILSSACGNNKTNTFLPDSSATAIPASANNPLTKEGIALGRKLFYDPILSVNDKVSCSSCHKQEKAFSDGLSLSNTGVSKKFLRRHTPALINVAWMQGLFWDGGAKNVESLIFAPLQHPDEMASSDVKALINKLSNHPEYPHLFKSIGEDSITVQGIARALAQFQRTLISANSRYDQYIRKEGASLSTSELRGLELFNQNCASCHKPGLFTDNQYHNNGLDDQFIDSSEMRIYQGRYRITYKPEDVGRFKTPTLRNLVYTAPYMHDGRFTTLEEVVDHYSSHVKKSTTLDANLIKNNAPGLRLSSEEKNRIIDFLKTLSDESFINNPDFASPSPK